MDYKDRFGTMLRQREQAAENLYFAQLESARRAAAAGKLTAAAATAPHHHHPGTCPDCHVRLDEVRVRALSFYQCGSCGKAWLDRLALHPFPRPGKPHWIGMLSDYYVAH